MTNDDLVTQAACHAYEILRRAHENANAREEDLRRPFHMMRSDLKIFRDGNQWCILFGENLQDGIAGFGDSPDLASYDFDKEWHRPLPPESGTAEQAIASCHGKVQQ